MSESVADVLAVHLMKSLLLPAMRYFTPAIYLFLSPVYDRPRLEPGT